MIKKTVFAVVFLFVFSAAGFSRANDFSSFSENTRKHLPENANALYTQNTMYFALGHYLAKHFKTTDPAQHLSDLYEKLVVNISSDKGISPYTAVYYGIFEYMITEDFFAGSGLQTFHHHLFPDSAYTGIELYQGFAEFYAEKSRYESFLSLYAATHEDTFVYEGFSKKYTQIFADLMRSLHVTILSRAGLMDGTLFLKTNASRYFPSDQITIKLTADRMESFSVEAISLDFGQTPDPFLFRDLIHDNGHVTLDTAVPEFSDYKTAAVHPVLTDRLTALPDEAWINIDIKDPFLIDPDYIEFSPYLLDVYEEYTLQGTKLLQPFDFIFTGGFPDDPATEENEAAINLAIPGEFTHLIMYLGRLADGTPVGAEMTTTQEEKQFSLRLIKLLEKVDDPFDSSGYDLPLVTVNTKKYKNVNARRLNSSDIDQLMYHSYDIYHRVMADIYDSLNYQYQFYWSGDLDDKNIYLVDDGLAGGAACTDYWLTLFEEMAGICIKGARMDRAGFISYYTSDPVGAAVTIPDFLNPFAFEVYVGSLLNFFGFNVIDPAPHTFSCDNSQETGVAIPDKLYNSRDLVDIAFIR